MDFTRSTNRFSVPVFRKMEISCLCVWHQWRSAAKKKLEEDDFSFAREVRDREKRLQALEEQLEQRARSVCFAATRTLSVFFSLSSQR